MTKRLGGALVAVAMLAGTAAVAQDMASDPKAGAQGAMSNQISGKVVQSHSKMLFIQESAGAVIPLKIDKGTKLEGMPAKKLSDLKAGDEVTVSFMVKNMTENVATEVSYKGMGGSGMDQQMQMQPQQQEQQQPAPQDNTKKPSY